MNSRRLNFVRAFVHPLQYSWCLLINNLSRKTSSLHNSWSNTFADNTKGNTNLTTSNIKENTFQTFLFVNSQFFSNPGENENVSFDAPVGTKRSVANIFKMTNILYCLWSFRLWHIFHCFFIIWYKLVSRKPSLHSSYQFLC